MLFTKPFHSPVRLEVGRPQVGPVLGRETIQVRQGKADEVRGDYSHPGKKWRLLSLKKYLKFWKCNKNVKIDKIKINWKIKIKLKGNILQAGTNKYASQRGMTGFGQPRDVVREARVKAENLEEIVDEQKIANLKGSTWLQSGPPIFSKSE